MSKDMAKVNENTVKARKLAVHHGSWSSIPGPQSISDAGPWGGVGGGIGCLTVLSDLHLKC